MSLPAFRTLKVAVDAATGVAAVQLCRPAVSNALSLDAFAELEQCFSCLGASSDVRCVLLSGEGNHFCSGIDLSVLATLENRSSAISCPARRAASLADQIRGLQRALTAVETCRVPVVAAIHGVCLGGGLDLACCCDVRYATKDASFCVLEIEVGLTADLGVLSRLPGIVGEGRARELALTARRFDGIEAAVVGLVSTQLFDDREALMSAALTVAVRMAGCSPVAVQGTKKVMLHSRDRSVSEGLEYVALLNAGQLVSSDLSECADARREKRRPIFAKM